MSVYQTRLYDDILEVAKELLIEVDFGRTFDHNPYNEGKFSYRARVETFSEKGCLMSYSLFI